MSRIQVTLTAVADRDPSCNLFTMTETLSFRVSEPPTPATIRAECRAFKKRYRDAWPHTQAAPTLIALDVTIQKVKP